jgi:hypothetical protein
VSRPSLRAVASAPFRLRTYRNLLYLALAFPLGIGYLVFFSVGLGLSVGLAIILVGVPLFLVVLLVTTGLVTVERWLATALLGVGIDPPDWRFTGREGVRDRAIGLVADPVVWLGLLFLASKFAIGVGAFVLLVTLLVPAVVLVGTPLFYDTPGVRVGVFLPTDISRELSLYVPWNELLVGVSFVLRLSSWQVTSLPGALAMSVLGVLVLVLSLNVLNGAAWLCGRWARLLLGATVLDRVR